ncbi:hypothetical protein M758_UG060100 [Ceratodon purpureus]|nr:hypothetical protein M758_UG060100 [Ceratodon purpureus]
MSRQLFQSLISSSFLWSLELVLQAPVYYEWSISHQQDLSTLNLILFATN